MEFFRLNFKKALNSKLLIAAILLLSVYANALAAEGEPLPPPVFSHKSGFYQHPISLHLKTDVVAANIYYTLDGSEPDPANLNGATYFYKNTYIERPGDTDGDIKTGLIRTHLYESYITIVNQHYEQDNLTQKSSSYHNPSYYVPGSPVFKGTVVRAIAFKAGHTPSPVVTHTYFIRDRNRYSLPVIAIATSEDNLFDYDKGIYTPGRVFDNWRNNNPDARADGGKPGNYHQRGNDWEYQATFTFWDEGSTVPELSQDVGIRLHGGWSRAQPMKSLRIYARSDYGKSNLEYPFFPDQDYNEYKRLVLRNSGNDNPNTLFRDALIQRVCQELNIDTQAYRPVVVFINGEYWGIHNIRERYDRHYIERVYGVEEEDLDLLTGNGWSKEGDNHHYWATINYIEENGVSDDIHYEYIKTRIDTENFIDYQIANIFSANTDWPGNNIDFWRKRTSEYQPDTPPGHDGRWRWMAFDMDFGFGIWWRPADENVMEFAVKPDAPGWPNPPWSTFLLRSLLENETFKNDFINRFADLLNTSFLPERVIHLIDEFTNELTPDFPEHIARWKRPASMSSWETEINLMLNFAERRTDYQWGHLIDYFDRDTFSIKVDVSDPGHGYIRINSIDIAEDTPGVSEITYPWTGRYFNGTPLRIEAVAKEGYVFSHWDGAENSEFPVAYTELNETKTLKANFIKGEEKELFHYWHFNNLTDDESLTLVATDFSAGDQGVLTYPGAGTGYMDRVEEGTDINMEMDQEPGFGLRVRNPSDTRELFIYASSEGFENLILSFAVKRTANGAYNQTMYASPDMGETWNQINETYLIEEEWKRVSFDLTGYQELNNNSELFFKIIFGGENAGGISGNNRFDNISLQGELIHEQKAFFSKSQGDLNELSSWGDNPDGTGSAPESFSSHATTYTIQNREKAVISGNWAVSGISSRVIVGNGIDNTEFAIPAAFSFSGKIDVNDHASLVLENTALPDLNNISSTSTVAFEQNGMTIVPIHTYGNLHLRNSSKIMAGNYTVLSSFIAENAELSFVEQTDITIEGNLTYLGNIETTNPENLNLYVTGNNDQEFFAEGDNQLDGYNIYFEKTAGSFITATDIHARNNLRLNFSGDAHFSDGGHLLQLGDDLRLTGNQNRYDLTGTILLSGDSGTNDMEIINIPLHNLVIDVAGDARVDFNDAADQIIIKNDLTIKSSSSRPVRLREKRFLIGGNLLLDLPAGDNVEQGESYLIFRGDQEQMITNLGYDGPGLLQNMIIKNDKGLTIENGSVTFNGLIRLEQGQIKSSGNKLIKSGPEGIVSQAINTSYVNGPMGKYVSADETEAFSFPIGKESGLRQIVLGIEPDYVAEALFIAEYFEETPPEFSSFQDQFFPIADEGFYNVSVSQEAAINRLEVTLSYRENDIPAEELTIAMLSAEDWMDIGGELVAGVQGMIKSTADIDKTGTFALAGQKESPNFVQEIQGELTVYPNPVRRNGFIFLPEYMDIMVYNSLGIMVRSESNVNELNLQGLPPGIYFLKNSRGINSKIVVLDH